MTHKGEFKRVFLSGAMFIAPFIIWQFTELFVVPPTAFTYRNWEALYRLNRPPSEGPFYPSSSSAMNERGDKSTPATARYKHAEWYTDRYGFRNRPEVADKNHYDIVLVGDSNIVGSYLDQKDTLQEVLARRCDCTVYAYAGGGRIWIDEYFRTERFVLNPPGTVIIEVRPWEFSVDVQGNINPQSPYRYDENPGRPIIPTKQVSSIELIVEKYSDRLHKQPLLQWLRARLMKLKLMREANASSPEQAAAPSAWKLSVERQNEYAYRQILKWKELVEKRGSKFMLLVMPFGIESAISRLESEGVTVVHGYRGLSHEQFFNVGQDGHWTEIAVQKTADAIVERWRTPSPRTGSENPGAD
jgi:hypothetical protein